MAEADSTGRQDYMTMAQAAEWLGVHPVTVRSWYDKGLLNGFRTQRRDELDEYERWGVAGARRIYKDETAVRLRDEHARRSRTST